MKRNWFWTTIFPVILAFGLGFFADMFFFQAGNKHNDDQWVVALNHITDVVKEGMGRETAIQKLEEYVKTLEQKNEKLTTRTSESSNQNERLMEQVAKLEKEKASVESKLEDKEEELRIAGEKYNSEHEQKVELEKYLTKYHPAAEIKEVEDTGIKIDREKYQLSDLVKLDDEWADMIDGFTDCFGNTHGESIKFYQTGEIRFSLNGEYDTLTITPFTSTNTSSEGAMRFEFYVDDEKREPVIEKVEKGKQYEPVTVSLSGGKVLKIKGIGMSYCKEIFLSEGFLEIIK